MSIVKECDCGRRFSAESWAELTLLGTMDNGRGLGELVELRQCPCGSTLTLPIGEHALSAPQLRIGSKSDG